MFEGSGQYGPFQVLGKVGSGGMGDVYRARDPRLNRDVAIKVLAHAGTDPSRQRRLTEEAQAASALNHPNIVTVYDVGVQDDVPFIVSELVDGMSLRGLLVRAPLNVREVLDLSVQMSEGLAAAHQAGIVHRDFKPENVMVTREGRVKILDFGLALVGAQQNTPIRDATLTQPLTIQGTVPYMSPEQARGAAVDYRTDQFSLGSTLYEMVTGRRAFQAETAAQTLAAILEDEPEPLAKLNPRVPAPLRWVIERCLAKDPRQRYESTSDLARELRTLRDRFSELGSSAEMAVPLAGRRRWIWPLLAAAALACLLVAAAAVARPDSSGFDFERYRFTPFATDPGYQGSPAWSPDGKTLAYVAAVEGVLQVFTKALGKPLPFQVTRSRFDCLQPFWGPDGTRLYYVSLFQQRLGLYSISALGGEPDPIMENVSRAAISPDGQTLALWRGAGNDYGGVYTLWLSSPPGNAPTQYSREPLRSQKFIEGVLRFSPDGSKIALQGVSVREGSTYNRIWIVPTRDADAYVTPASEIGTRFLVGGFSWLPDSRHIVGAIMAPRPGLHLWLLDTESPRARLIVPSGGIESDPAVSPDGARLAMSFQQSNSDVYRLSIDQPTPHALLASARNELDPASAGGKIALTTDRSGTEEIWLSDQNGALERSLVSANDFAREKTDILRSAAFSPDGQRLAYHRSSTSGRIWISPVAGGPPVLLTDADGEQDNPTWSPDGAWVAYAQGSADRGQWSLSKMRPGGKAPSVLLAHDIIPFSPVKWAPDNAWIAFNRQEGLSVVSPDGQSTKVLAQESWMAFEWSEDGHRLFGIRLSDDYKHLAFTSIDIRSGVERVLSPNMMPMPMSPQPVRGFARLSASTFVTSIVKVSSDIWILEGFEPASGGWGPLARLFRMPGR